MTLLIDDPTPCINPLYYFASQVPTGAVDYHYTKKNEKWYFDSDSDFKFPIIETIDQEFVHEFARWVSSTKVSGKISVIPFPAGLGRIDRRKFAGFPKSKVIDFISTFRDEISQKFDIGPEMLTHTRALNPRTGNLLSGISEHDWSQKQNSKTLTRYIEYALQILESAGLNPTGVTSPCNFGMYVEGEYAKAVLNAGASVLGHKVLWYFLNVDPESLNVDHRVMYLNRDDGEAVISIMGSMNDPLWSSQLTDLNYEDWNKKVLDPILSADGEDGRIAKQVRSGSYVTIVTHWQSLYSNGSRYGLRGLDELVSRINKHFGDKIIWMRCTEIARYLACTSSVTLRNRLTSKDLVTINLASPFSCRDFTFSFEEDSTPEGIFLSLEKGKDQGENLERVSSTELLKPNSWVSVDAGNGRIKIIVCLAQLFEREKNIIYGVTKKTERRLTAKEYYSNLTVTW